MMTLFKVLAVIVVLVIVFNIGRCFGLSEALKIEEATLMERKHSGEEVTDAKKIHNS